jgi:hypothetical protein
MLNFGFGSIFGSLFKDKPISALYRYGSGFGSISEIAVFTIYTVRPHVFNKTYSNHVILAHRRFFKKARGRVVEPPSTTLLFLKALFCNAFEHQIRDLLKSDQLLYLSETLVL